MTEREKMALRIGAAKWPDRWQTWTEVERSFYCTFIEDILIAIEAAGMTVVEREDGR